MKEIEKMTSDDRAEVREILEEYCTVEFSISKQDPIFQFRVRDLSPSGMGILVNDGSKALGYLKVGQILEMKYNPENLNDQPRHMKTEIRHITLLEEGRYRGQYLVGLLIKNGSKPSRSL